MFGIFFILIVLPLKLLSFFHQEYMLPENLKNLDAITIFTSLRSDNILNGQLNWETTYRTGISTDRRPYKTFSEDLHTKLVKRFRFGLIRNNKRHSSWCQTDILKISGLKLAL